MSNVSEFVQRSGTGVALVELIASSSYATDKVPPRVELFPTRG